MSISESNSSTYLIEGILPDHAISINIGASGTGKTTWDLQSFEAAANGAPVFGRFGINMPGLQPVYFVSLDRTSEELEKKFKSIRIPSDLFQYKSFRQDLNNKHLLERIFHERPPDTKIVVLDGIGFLVEKVISQFHVGQFISRLDRIRADSDNPALKLIHHTPKVKGADGYQDPREKGLGSGAWCQMAAVSIIFEKVNPGDIHNPFRRIWLCYTDQPDVELAFKLTDRLEWLPDGFPSDQWKYTWSIVDIMKHWECSQAEAYRIRQRLMAGDDPESL